MLRNLNATYAGKRILASPYVGVLAATIAAETADGDQGPGILHNEAIDPAYAGKYLRAWITNPPASGTLTVAENGAIEGYDLPVGTHTFNYDLIANDAYDSASYFTVTVGVQDASATGATLTGTASFTAGGATATSAGEAPGVVLTGAASFTAGGATATSAGEAPGIVLIGTASFLAGVATGDANAIVAGATLMGASSLVAGSAYVAGTVLWSKRVLASSGLTMECVVKSPVKTNVYGTSPCSEGTHG